MRLFLTSDALTNDILKHECKKLIVVKPIDKIKVIVFTIQETDSDKGYLQKSIEQLQAINIKIDNISIFKLNKDNPDIKLTKYDVIYVCGGNTFHYLNWFREKGLVSKIIDSVNGGKPYIGVSAGSYLTCPTIEMANWKHPDRNDVGMSDLSAFSFVPFLLTVHYKPSLKEDIALNAKNNKREVKILTDGQALVVKNDDVRLVGVGKEVNI